MHFIFRPKSKLAVPRWVARLMNALNMLGPVLLLVAIAAAVTARFGGLGAAESQWLLKLSILLAVVALVIRVAWGIAVRVLYRVFAERD